MEKTFIDTNIIVYANDKKDNIKQKKAIRIITEFMKTGQGIISTQVLQEYAYVALTKLKQTHNVILRQLKLLETFTVIKQSPEMIRRTLEIMHVYKINFWDSCIISNAEFAHCSVIYSEDFNTGQYYSGIKIVNPL